MPLPHERRSLASAPALPRRGFLAGLAALPLVGGGLTLIGTPTAAAVPTTRELMESYKTWLFYEHRMLSYEMAEYDLPVAKAMERTHWPSSPGGTWHFQWGQEGTRGPAGWIDAPQASTRAAVILSAAGVPLSGERHG